MSLIFAESRRAFDKRLVASLVFVRKALNIRALINSSDALAGVNFPSEKNSYIIAPSSFIPCKMLMRRYLKVHTFACGIPLQRVCV